MKGTVRKSPQVSTLAQAEALLQVPKEQAENLMIVDLVRHDLHGVCGSGNVSVPRLMVVEEYASVFQMISVVEGQILQVPIEKEGARTRYTGVDVLAASLPPGSMTGAPKKRSCEILQEIEGYKDRSLYSGVVGYMDVGGRGDFSVNIRCMFRWDDEGEGDGGSQDAAYDDGEIFDEEVWHIGAGGAVTALSTPVAEREEMQTKLAGTLGVFGLSPGN
jgi:para-aminobenzoate synthetase